MQEVPAHMHLGPIVPDVLSRQHEHRSDLIWSPDHKTCYTDLQCGRFGRNLFQCYSTAPRRRVMRQFARAHMVPDACETRLDLHRVQIRGNDHTYWGTQHASHIEA
ncbi:hypothetical protein M9H77_22333 [Catharanthus roseus]|uniref:Uncharacterized protein n=1 Tax=Catharanthus roseus TaxID=4058 RepID=A0ACC0AQ74_CATRO|nr:hypothetical protein M9H77_22333 [Catharanthus roseus]